MPNRYWVGGSGDWSDSSHWSTASGGAGGASLPGINDDVIFDAASGSGPVTIVVEPPTRQIRSINSSLFSDQLNLTIRGSLVSIELRANSALHNNVAGSGISLIVVSSMSLTQSGAIQPTYQRGFSLRVRRGNVLTLLSNFDGDILTVEDGGSLVAHNRSLDLQGFSVFEGASFTANSPFISTAVSFSFLGSYSGSNLRVRAASPFSDYMGGQGFSARGLNFSELELGPRTLPVAGNMTVGALKIAPGSDLRISRLIDITIGSLEAIGTPSQQISLRSSTPGSRFTLRKTSGAVDAYFLNIQDSSASGGAAWTAHNSVDSGNNQGWTFLGPTVPEARFANSAAAGRAPLEVAFTDLSTGMPDEWLWTFGDGTTSTDQHPTKVYSEPGVFTVSLRASNALGANTVTKASLISATATVIQPEPTSSALALGLPAVLPGDLAVPVNGAEASSFVSSVEKISRRALIDGIEAGSAVSAVTMITGRKNVFPDEISSGLATGADHIISVGLVKIPVESANAGSAVSSVLVAPGPVAMIGIGAIAAASAVDQPTMIQSPPPPPPPTDWEAIGKEDEKSVVYHITHKDGTYLGSWEREVTSKPQFRQRINTPSAVMTVQLARSPNTTKEMRAPLVTQDGQELITQDGFGFEVPYETNNSVGAGTDVDINLNVDAYVQYGEFSLFETQDGETLITQDGQELLAASGAPNGRRIFSGYIEDYELLYGGESGVLVTVLSHGAELSQQLVKSGEAVVMNYPTQEITATLESIIETERGVVDWNESTLVPTGVSVPARYALNTKLEAIEDLYKQTPDGYYWYVDLGTNLLHLQPRSTVADHTFTIGHHVKTMRLKRSQSQLRNLTYFVGQENEATGISILKKYEDAASQSQWRTGLHRITDRRYSVPDSMQRRANKEMQPFAQPAWTTTVFISAARYDIESISIGQMVNFANGEGLEDLLLQIVDRDYSLLGVSLQLGAYLDDNVDAIGALEAGIANEQYQSIPNTPS